MSIEKQINILIANSIKRNEAINENQLHAILGNMTDNELTIYWMHFIGSLSFSKTETNAIPDWQTRNNEKYFKNQFSDYIYYPSIKISKGNYVFDRNEFENHVVIKLINYISKMQNEQVKVNESIIKRLYSKIATLFFSK